MRVLTRATKKRRLEEEGGEEEERRLKEDRISRLPDDVLGEIVSLLPTKDGARTQVLSSRWRLIWRAAPLNLDLDVYGGTAISRILSSHHGPVRRFAVRAILGESRNQVAAAAAVDSWLRSPALDNLEELEFHLGDPPYGPRPPPPPPPMPASARRFFSTLRAASFGACTFPNGGELLHLPLLKQLTLFNAMISEKSFLALLVGCPVLQSLLLLDINVNGGNRVQIRSSTLRSIGVRSNWSMGMFRKLVIEDAPCLERFMFFRGNVMDISVISAPRLGVLGLLNGSLPRLSFGTTWFQGLSNVVSFTTVVGNVKVLAIPHAKLTFVEAIKLMKCFPNLEKLYIKAGRVVNKSVWRVKYWKLIRTLDICLKKIVLSDYRGDKSRINFVKFFISNARVLESITLELGYGGDPSRTWIEKQYKMLQIRKWASRGVHFDFVSRNMSIESLSNRHAAEREQVHDLSTTDPFERFP